MLYLLAQWLKFEGLFNLVRYQTFRAGATLLTALILGLLIGPKFISMLRVRQGKGQPIRADGPQSHLAKVGTPTMGGLMILTSLIISMLLWMDLRSPFSWACLAVTAGFGAIGFLGFYLSALVVSILPSYLRHLHDARYRSLGASGAVSAVMFSFILFAPWAKIVIFPIPFGIPAVLYAVLYVGYSIWMERRGGEDGVRTFVDSYNGVGTAVQFYYKLRVKGCGVVDSHLSHIKQKPPEGGFAPWHRSTKGIC